MFISRKIILKALNRICLIVLSKRSGREKVREIDIGPGYYGSSSFIAGISVLKLAAYISDHRSECNRIIIQYRSVEYVSLKQSKKIGYRGY